MKSSFEVLQILLGNQLPVLPWLLPNSHTKMSSRSFGQKYPLINALVLVRIFILIFCSKGWLIQEEKSPGLEALTSPLWHQCPIALVPPLPSPHPRQVRPAMRISHTHESAEQAEPSGNRFALRYSQNPANPCEVGRSEDAAGLSLARVQATKTSPEPASGLSGA